MWSQLFLCALIGFAAASNNGWRSNMEYEYKVHGRTLTSFHELGNQYSGILMKASLIVRPQGDDILMAKIANAQYSQVHANLPEGWKSDIPEQKLQYKRLELSEKPFQIFLKNGIVRDIVVDGDCHNWEANIIKAIVSQVQLDTSGEHVVKSHVNQLPEGDDNTAVFKTMEDTVSGTYETLYDIAPLADYVWQSQSELVPMPELIKDGEVIEIVKTKNFSRAEERLAYYHGLGEMGQFEPATNHIGDFFLRSGNSRVIVTGNLKRYTIQSATTTNKVIVSPTLNSEQKGMVVSYLNITLNEFKPCTGSFEMPQQGQKLGSLNYRFNTPFDGKYEARQGYQRQHNEDNWYSSEEDSREEYHQYQQYQQQNQGQYEQQNEGQYQGQYHQHKKQQQHYRNRRSVQQGTDSVEQQEQWAQEEAKLSQPPHSPLLPLYVGYKGKSIKYADKVDVVNAAKKLAQQIGKEMEQPEDIRKEQTLAKFVILCSVARVMSEKEMQEVAQQLYVYSEQQQQPAALNAWYVYRDCIAEAGTGPALLTIQDWIKNKKITHEEAAEVVATMADSARQPTEEYMRTFFQFVKDHEVQQQYLLNDTAILAYCNLARKVYVDKLASHNEYPVHSFGSFATEQGKQFIVDELIPYLNEKLNYAVQHADSHKVLVYIRALGNLAHQKILEVFEPYLEGEKQCSQFQRLSMVICLDEFAYVHPKIAQSVFYKLYQNSADVQEVRVAAVYQLMRTEPSATMLQRMAQYTNVDTCEQVNAAVKSSIETAAQLEAPEYANFAEIARAAQPLLTKNVYGVQYSQNFLRSRVQYEMNMWYKQTAQFYGSQDSIFAKGFRYGLRAAFGGAQRYFVNVHAMVSSVDELTNVFQRQFHKYEQRQQQQQQGFRQAQQQKYSPEYIAEQLNLKNDEREQFEGNFLIQLFGGAQRYFTFNNQTLEMMPQYVQQIEEILREGKTFQYSKLMSRFDIAISFPTEMGFPFIYTLDAPTAVHFHGKVRATSEPKMCNGQIIRVPETVTAHAEIRAHLSARLQAKIGFITPFDFQQYVSGYDKNIQLYLPIKSQYEFDLKNKQVHAQFQPIQQDKNTQIFHYSSWPYTAKHNILSLEPIANSPHCKIIYAEQEPQTQFNHVFGKEAGMAFRVEYVSEQKFADAMWFYEQYQRHDFITALFAPFYEETMQHTKLNIEYDAQKSSARKVQFRFGYEKLYEQEQGQGNVEISQFAQLPNESKARQHQFAKMASSGIASSMAHVVDAVVEFEGQKKAEYVATFAFASSPVAEKARVLFYYKKQGQKNYQVAFSGKANVPNTNGLDYVYALQFDPTTTAQAEIAFGEDLQSATKFNLHAKFQQSEARRQYLKDSYRAQECHDEMKHGNTQLPACANMTAEANLMDRVNVHFEFQHLSPKFRNITHKFYNGLRYFGYFNLDENTVDPQTTEKDNEVTFQARFEPARFESVNVTIRTHKMESHIDNIRVNQWAKQIFVFHPVFRMVDRVMGEALELDAYRPFCVVDQTAANTFDNKTYPLNLGNDWTVMMHYAPSFARQGHQYQKYQQQQEEQQLEQYALLVRDAKNGQQKEVKMTVRTPECADLAIELQFHPVGQCGDNKQCAKIVYNGQEIQYDNKKVHQIKNGLIKIYALPNGDVKVEVKNAFYVIYDGERVKLTATHDKLRGAVRGLCGTFTGEQVDDFLAPQNCIYQHPEAFVAAYQIEQSNESRQGRYNYKKSQHAGQHECVEQEYYYANVISDQDAGRKHHQYNKRNQYQQHHYGQQYQHQNNEHVRHGNDDQSSCVAHQTRYEVREFDNEICFTIRPLPVCRSHCSAERVIEKKVPVHCVQKSSVSQMWKQQIDNGASPDFSHKEATKTIKIQVHQSCARN